MVNMGPFRKLGTSFVEVSEIVDMLCGDPTDLPWQRRCADNGLSERITSPTTMNDHTQEKSGFIPVGDQIILAKEMRYPFPRKAFIGEKMLCLHWNW